MEGISTAILAGGLGTRLRSVVADRPKVLAPVAGRPFIAHLLEQLARAGVRRTTLLLGFAADQVRATFGNSYDGISLQYSTENEPLGTGGALRLALPQLTEPTILLLNGDSYCDVDMATLIASHRARLAQATLALAQVADVSRYGSVCVDESQRLVRFEEKGAARGRGWINAGMYLLNRAILETIPAGQAVSLEREVLPQLIQSQPVFGFPGGKFIDIGTPESYSDAESFFSAPPDARH
jgi:D-glycero-alpha-D-manno-heptose 1-phosphate guanylyltransferase